MPENGDDNSLPEVVTEPKLSMTGALGEVTLQGVGLWVAVALVGAVVLG